ncbi:MAG: AmmeMemoRadiSam system protein B [Calditrichaeota bacterium]|nr:AmmeMemoRadiSam system protein B [Calditrichota bacterium]
MRTAVWLSLSVVLLSVPLRGQTTRGLVDSVGYATRPEQMEALLPLVQALEAEELARDDSAVWAVHGENWVTGISPHDDYVYAGRVYWHLFRKYHAKTAILIGVAHKAWRWNEADRLIFDAFRYWRGPWGKVPVSALREELLGSLPKEHVVVSNAYESEEHSLEGLIPWLQMQRRDVEIVPILVPYMHWGRMDTLATELARALAKAVKARQWVWGKDFVILISSDAVHYGDEGWGGKNYAPFGADSLGHAKAVQREYDLIRRYLTGPIQGERLRDFLYTLVDSTNLRNYKITWCGRFSIPFGLDLSRHLASELGRPVPEGYLLRYGDSWTLGRLPVSLGGLGVTAPRSLHHWVGYAAIVYF